MIVQKWYERIINSKDQFFIDDKFDSIYNKRNIVKEGSCYEKAVFPFVIGADDISVSDDG